jgi:hypothetical protein
MTLETFEKHFYFEYKNIAQDLDELKDKQRDIIQLQTSYESISNRIELIHNYFREHSACLSTYEQRKAQDHLSKLSNQASQTRDKIFPKKKFEFKSKKNLTKTDVDSVCGNADVNASVKNKVDKTYEHPIVEASVSLHTCNINDLENQTIVKTQNDIVNADIGIFNLKNCVVKLKGTN